MFIINELVCVSWFVFIKYVDSCICIFYFYYECCYCRISYNDI